MKRLAILLATTLLILGACSSYHDTSRLRFDAMPLHYTQFDLQLAWEVKPEGGRTVVNGIAKNVRWAYMYDLEIWVAALDAAGKTVARSVSYVIPRQLNLDDSAKFSVKLPVTVPPGTKLRFTYQYRGSDGGEEHRFGEGGTPWIQSFESAVP